MKTRTLHAGKAFICLCDDGVYGRLASGRGFSLRYVGKSYSPLFSERNGYRKAIYWMGFRFEVLKP